jgi:hypothetical protein
MKTTTQPAQHPDAASLADIVADKLERLAADMAAPGRPCLSAIRTLTEDRREATATLRRLATVAPERDAAEAHRQAMGMESPHLYTAPDALTLRTRAAAWRAASLAW